MAKGDARRAADKWLKDQGLIDELTSEDYEEAKKLIGSRSFGIFWALLRYRREESAIFLTNAALGSPQNDCAASVLQGSIKAIDSIRDLVLDLAEPSAAAADGNEEQK